MYISKLKLKNFGQHKDLEINDLGESTVIGILGKNGSGKSTIVLAIEFAFLGKLSDSITSWITKNETNGYVELEFIKDNKKGYILRKFGKTNSRKFIWDNQEYTKASDVDYNIERILGIDKQVLSGCVFVKQGELTSMLEATPQKRIELFSKFLNLSFLNKRVEILNATQKELEDSVTDIKSIQELLDNTNNELIINQNLLNTKLEEFNKKYISQDFIKELKNNIVNYLFLLKEKEKYIQIYKDFISKKQELDNILQQYNILDINKFIENYHYYKNNKNYLNIINDKQKELNETSTRISKLKTIIAESQLDEQNLKNIIKNKRDEINLNKQIKNNLSILLDIKYKLKSKLNKENTKCPICGLKILDGQEVTEDQIDSLNQCVKAEEEKIKKLEIDFNIKNNELDKLSKDINIFISDLNYSNHIKDQCKNIIAENTSKIKTDLEISKEFINIYNQEGFIEKIIQLSYQINANKDISKEIDKIDDKFKEINITSYIEKLEKVNSQIGNFSIENLLGYIESIIEKEIQNIEFYKSKNITLKENIDCYINKIKDLENKNNKIYKAIQEVENLKNEINIKEENSIPRKYLSYLFKYILKNISEYLTYFDANFVIDIEDKNTLEFKFKRIDKINEEWIEMGHLSGGQKIKLSIAFLISIQKIICPDLKFLILDEPSTHLDIESIEALSNLLKQLTVSLKNQIDQIWVIDHNQILETSFNKIIKLS